MKTDQDLIAEATQMQVRIAELLGERNKNDLAPRIYRHMQAMLPVQMVVGDMTRFVAELSVLQRHACCGEGSGFCDDGGHGYFEEPGLGCPDLHDLAVRQGVGDYQRAITEGQT